MIKLEYFSNLVYCCILKKCKFCSKNKNVWNIEIIVFCPLLIKFLQTWNSYTLLNLIK